MIELRMTERDVFRLRFSVSPLWETLAAARVLTTGGASPALRPWLDQIDAGALDLSRLAALQAPRGYTPDFLTPAPLAGERSIEAELELVRRTPVDVVAAELDRCLRQRAPVDDVLPELVRRPAFARAQLVHDLEQVWACLVAPYWPRLHRVLAGDVDHRSRRLVSGGIAALLEDLDPSVTWEDSTLRVSVALAERRDLSGEGVVLMPSAFQAGRPVVVLDPPYQPTLIYLARGVATAWASSPAPADALVRLLGRGRADLLAVLDEPAGTGVLARGLGRSAGTISEHLQTLRAAGLVDVRRSGRASHWSRTALGDALVAGPLTA
jgi:hypothetical protein